MIILKAVDNVLTDINFLKDNVYHHIVMYT